MFTDLFEDLCFSEHLKSGCDKTWEGGGGGGGWGYTNIYVHKADIPPSKST